MNGKAKIKISIKIFLVLTIFSYIVYFVWTVLGDITDLRPNVNGYSNQWDLIGAATRWQATSDNSDLSYISENGAINTYQAFQLTDVPVGSTIDSVQMIWKCGVWGGTGPPERIDTFVRMDGTNQQDLNGATLTDNSFVNISGMNWTTMPNTSAWTVDAVNNMEAVVMSDTLGTGEEIRCSEVYAKVWYTPAAADSTPPNWFDNTTSVVNGSQYSPGKNYQFNVTWNDSESDVHIVLIEHNFTGGGPPSGNDTVSNESDVYYYEFEDMASGTYVWKMYANNTDGYWNVTNSGTYWEYIVEQNQTNPVDIYIDNGTVYKNENITIDYGIQIDTNGTAIYSNSGTVNLYRNESSVSNPEIITLGASTYVYKANITGNSNYTDNSTGATYYLFVNKGDPTSNLNVYIDGLADNKTISYPTVTNVSANESVSEDDDCTYILWRNETQLIGGSDVWNYTKLGNDTYTFKYNMSGTCSNWTLESSQTLYLYVNKGTPSLRLDNNESWSAVYPTPTNTTGYDCPTDGASDVSCNLYRNDSGQLASNEDNVLLGVMAYNYSYNTSGGTNWTSYQNSSTLVISINTSTQNYMNLTLGTGGTGTEDNKTYGYITTTNATGWFDANAFVGSAPVFNLYRNDTLIAGGNPVSNVIELGANYYQYIYNTSGNTNYSSASKIFFLNITKANPTANLKLALNGSESDETYIYPEIVNATGWVTLTDNQDLSFTLYRNYVSTGQTGDPATEEILLGNATYVYEYNTTGGSNYSSGAIIRTAYVNKGTVSPSLSINTSWTETYPTDTSVSCSVTSVDNEVSCLLWRDGVSKTSPDEELLGVGSYTYKTNTSQTANYSANNTGESQTLTIQVNTSSSIDLFLNNSQANFDMDAYTALNTTAVLVIPSSSNIEIWTNYSDGGWNLWDSCSDCSSLENVTVLTESGIWNFTANLSNVNYSSAYESWYANMTGDTASPQWSQQGSNTTLIGVGEPIKLYANWSDNINLNYAWLSTNETGEWKNKSGVYGSPIDINLSASETWSNFTWQNTSTPAGTIVGWRIYANDSNSNENVTNIQSFTLNVTELWNFSTNGSIFSSPAIADINGDTFIDVVIGSDDFNIYALNGTNGSKLWNYSTEGAVGSSPSLANVTGSGDDLEVIVGSFDNSVYVLNGTNGSKIWNVSLGGYVWSSPAIDDVDNDNLLDIVIGSDNWTIYAFNGTGGLIWNFTAEDSIWSSPVIANITQDEFIEVIFTSYDNNTYVLNGSNGSKIWNFSALNMIESSPAVDDINNDNLLEVVFGSYDNKIYALNGTNGNELWNFSTNDWVISSPVIANITGDNTLKIVVGSDDGTVYALSGDGSSFWNFTVPTGGRIESSPAIADMNDDGINDVIVASSDNRVYALNGSTGTQIWSYNTRNYLFSSPAVEDINGDGKLDIVIGSFNEKIYSLDPPSGWNMFGGNQRRTRVLDRSSPINLKYGVDLINGSAIIYSYWRDLYSNLGLGIIEENSNGMFINHSINVFGTTSWINYTIDNCPSSSEKNMRNCIKQCTEMWKTCEGTKNECHEEMKQCKNNCKNSEIIIEYKIHVFDTFNNEGVVEDVLICGGRNE